MDSGYAGYLKMIRQFEDRRFQGCCFSLWNEFKVHHTVLDTSCVRTVLILKMLFVYFAKQMKAEEETVNTLDLLNSQLKKVLLGFTTRNEDSQQWACEDLD